MPPEIISPQSKPVLSSLLEKITVFILAGVGMALALAIGYLKNT